MPGTTRRTRRAMNLHGTDYQRGDEISDEVWATIPEGRQQALLRTELIQMYDDEDASIPKPSRIVVNLPDGTQEIIQDPDLGITPDGVLCPVCNEGPFKRVAQHITRMHVETTMDTGLLSSSSGPGDSMNTSSTGE